MKLQRVLNQLPEELLNILISLFLNLLFLIIIAIPLSFISSISLILITKAYGILWLAILATVLLLTVVENIFKIKEEGNLYLILNSLASAFLVLSWTFFICLNLNPVLRDSSLISSLILGTISFLSSYVTFIVVTSFYQGSLYKIINLSLALISYLGFTFFFLFQNRAI